MRTTIQLILLAAAAVAFARSGYGATTAFMVDPTVGGNTMSAVFESAAVRSEPAQAASVGTMASAMVTLPRPNGPG